MWESSTERVPMTPAIAARLGAEPGDLAMRTTYTFMGDGKPVMVSVSWEPAELTAGTAIMFAEEGPHAGQGVVERMAAIGQRITHAEETVTAPCAGVRGGTAQYEAGRDGDHHRPHLPHGRAGGGDGRHRAAGRGVRGRLRRARPLGRLRTALRRASPVVTALRPV